MHFLYGLRDQNTSSVPSNETADILNFIENRIADSLAPGKLGENHTDNSIIKAGKKLKAQIQKLRTSANVQGNFKTKIADCIYKFIIPGKTNQLQISKLEKDIKIIDSQIKDIDAQIEQINNRKNDQIRLLEEAAKSKVIPFDMEKERPPPCT